MGEFCEWVFALSGSFSYVYASLFPNHFLKSNRVSKLNDHINYNLRKLQIYLNASYKIAINLAPYSKFNLNNLHNDYRLLD